MGTGAPSSRAEAASADGSGKEAMAGPGEVGRGRARSGPRPGRVDRTRAPRRPEGPAALPAGRAASEAPSLPSRTRAVSAAAPDVARIGPGSEKEGALAERPCGEGSVGCTLVGGGAVTFPARIAGREASLPRGGILTTFRGFSASAPALEVL